MADNNRKPTVTMFFFCFISLSPLSLYLKSDFEVSKSLSNLKNVRVITREQNGELLTKVSISIYSSVKIIPRLIYFYCIDMYWLKKNFKTHEKRQIIRVIVRILSIHLLSKVKRKKSLQRGRIMLCADFFFARCVWRMRARNSYDRMRHSNCVEKWQFGGKWTHMTCSNKNDEQQRKSSTRTTL